MEKLNDFMWKLSLFFFLLMIFPIIVFALIKMTFTKTFIIPRIPQNKWTNWIIKWQQNIEKALL